MSEAVRELVLPVLQRQGATRAFARLDRVADERSTLTRALSRGEERGSASRRRLRALEDEDARLAIALDAAVKSLPLLSPVVAAERLVRRAIADRSLGVADSEAFGRNLAALADAVVATWLPDVALARVRRKLRDGEARRAAPRLDALREDDRLGWAAVGEAELFARAAARLGDGSDPSDAACLRALGAVPPVQIAIAASAAAGVLRPNLDHVEPVLRADGTVAAVPALGSRALLLAGLRALRAAVDAAFPGVRPLLVDEPDVQRADGPYRRAERADPSQRGGSLLIATIDEERLQDEVDAALDGALELELQSRVVYDDVFERTPLSKCMAEDDVYEPDHVKRRRIDVAAARLGAGQEALLAIVRAGRRHHAPSRIRGALLGVLASATAAPSRPTLAGGADAAKELLAWCEGTPEVPRDAARAAAALQLRARERLDAFARDGKPGPYGPLLALGRDVACALAGVLEGAPSDGELLLDELARGLGPHRPTSRP